MEVQSRSPRTYTRAFFFVISSRCLVDAKWIATVCPEDVPCSGGFGKFKLPLPDLRSPGPRQRRIPDPVAGKHTESLGLCDAEPPHAAIVGALELRDGAVAIAADIESAKIDPRRPMGAAEKSVEMCRASCGPLLRELPFVQKAPKMATKTSCHSLVHSRPVLPGGQPIMSEPISAIPSCDAFDPGLC